jgi:hypothetical protein
MGYSISAARLSNHSLTLSSNAANIIRMDSWYAAKKLMAVIEELGKVYYCPLKTNR